MVFTAEIAARSSTMSAGLKPAVAAPDGIVIGFHGSRGEAGNIGAVTVPIVGAAPPAPAIPTQYARHNSPNSALLTDALAIGTSTGVGLAAAPVTGRLSGIRYGYRCGRY